jgi:hypothetical protein
MGTASANSNSKIEDERKAAENAKAVLGWLTPSNARTERIISVLRTAANIATSATFTRLERRNALDALRNKAAKSLNIVCGLLDKGRLSADAIDEARRAVIAWLNALPHRVRRRGSGSPRSGAQVLLREFERGWPRGG